MSDNPLFYCPHCNYRNDAALKENAELRAENDRILASIARNQPLIDDMVQQNEKLEKQLAVIKEILFPVMPKLTDSEKALLSKVYGRIWTEAYYDPYNEETKKFALSLAPLMAMLNDTLKFKD